MTLLQQANQALRDQRYDAALGLYLQLLQQGSVPASAVHPSLRILQRRLQGLRDPAQKAKLQQISDVLAQPSSSPGPLTPSAAPTPALADQAAQARDWALAAQRWEQILRQPNPALEADALVRASQALFQADNFLLAHQALRQALAKAPEHARAKREHKNQYYYHAYSDWLMQTTEGRGDWYQADGLSERPDWKTAVDLCRPYIDKPRDAIAANDLRQWTQAGLLWAEEHWDRQDNARAIAILRETLAPLTAACPPELTPALIETIETARATPEADRSASSQRLQQALSALDSDTLRVPEWLCLYDALNWNGLLQLGYLARQHAIQRALRQADANDADQASLQQGARAALDQGELERAGRYLARLPEEVQKTAAVSELRAVQALFAGDLEAFRKQWPHPPRAVDQRFRDYLRGKSVAVVGPAPTGSADGAEIDSFDVVVRMNWRGAESQGEEAEFGSKTHVSLYNAHTVRLLSAEGRLGLVKALDFCLIRRTRYDLDRQTWDDGRVRILSEYPVVFHKSLNAVPAALFDLLLHGAEEIKVFATSFYLGTKQHNAKYRGHVNISPFNPLRASQPIFANHCLLSQVTFVNQLRNQRLIDTARPPRYALDIEAVDYLTWFESLTKPQRQLANKVCSAESELTNFVFREGIANDSLARINVKLLKLLEARKDLCTMDLLAFKRYIKGKRIALVANSSELLDFAHGSLIDSADIVCRFNAFEIIPDHTGSKTDVHAAVYMHSYKYNEYVPVRFINSVSADRWAAAVKSNVNAYAQGSLLLLNHIQELIWSSRNNYIEIAPPSTGFVFLMILLAIGGYQEISMYGFTFYKNNSSDDILRSSELPYIIKQEIAEIHDYDLEASFVKNNASEHDPRKNIFRFYDLPSIC